MKLKEIRKNTAKLLSENGIEASAFETDVILQTVLGFDKTTLIMKLETELSTDTVEEISIIAQKRVDGYPLQYIVGSWGFYGRDFAVGEGVLIPRADTETVIDVAKTLFDKNSKIKVIDLCSGSGCIAITLEKELNAKVYALEKSETAYEYLVKNIELNKSTVTPMLCDVLDEEPIKGFAEVDLIVSNPPYIKTSEISALSKEVSYEPVMALDGEEDGLKFYRKITRTWKKTLKNDGYLIFEIGNTQADEVQKILEDNAFCEVTIVYDLAKNPRVVYARKQ